MGRASTRKRAKRQVLFIQRTKVPERTCPVCHSVWDGAASVTREPITRTLQEGDMTLCIVCQTWLTADAGGFRVATQAEYDEVVAKGEPVDAIEGLFPRGRVQ